jgi:hypothetical protein
MGNELSGTGRSRRSLTVVAVGLLACSVWTAGCKNLLKKRLGADAGATSSAAAAADAPKGQDLADEQLQDKLDEYIKCLNSLSSPIHKSRQRYLSYIPKTGPTGREQHAELVKLEVGASASCATGIAKSKTMPPSDTKLESAGLEFSQSASEIDRLTNEAETYFDLRLFRSDKWAKGKEMHPQLMTAWSRFSKADKDLHDALDGITKPLSQRTLARIEREDGKKFRYGRKKVLITARELVDASDPVGEDDDLDPGLYAASYSELEKAIDELTTYGSVHKAELSKQGNPSWPLAAPNYDQFVRAASEYKDASKGYWRCLQDAPAKAKTSSGKIDLHKLGSCGGRPAWKAGDEAIKKYNEFIRASNSHQFP